MHTEGEVEAIFGRAPHEIAGTPVLTYVHPHDHGVALDMWMELLGAPGGTRTIRQRMVHPDGRIVWIESTVINHLSQRTGAIVSVSHDIGPDLRREAELAASERRFRALAEEMPLGVFEADAQGVLIYGNSRFVREVAEPGSRLGLVAAESARPGIAEHWRRLVAGELPQGLHYDVDNR